jgi:hypothetical protein
MSTISGSARTYGPMKSCRRVVSAASARASDHRRTSRSSPCSSALARASITPVSSPSAGPPCGALYLMPPSSGGLWLGVMTMPSASPESRPRLCSRIANETAGVGV